MEANFFRFLAQEVGPRQVGLRVEKIYAPLPGAWTIKLGSRVHLVCAACTRHRTLFVSAHKPDNPQSPPPEVGWWRKRVQGRRILEYKADWPSRRLAFSLDKAPGAWLIADMQNGLSLVDDLDPGFGQEPAWPSWDQIMSQPGIFRSFPQITPPLRHTLAALDEKEGRALLQYLQSADSPSTLTWARSKAGVVQDWLVPWSVPSSLQERFIDILSYTEPGEAGRDFGWAVLESLARAQTGSGSRTSGREKKLRKQLAGITDDEERLGKMAARGEQAEVLKSNLYKLDPEVKVSSLQLGDSQGRTWTLSLDPRLSVQENMEQWYRQARKGRRGLEHAARRRREAEEALAALQNSEQDTAARDGQGPGTGMWSSKAKGQAKSAAGSKDTVVYRSRDGFTILRGKNSRANHSLLTRTARPHDLWFHAAYGPGAHVVLRRSGPTTEVPETSRLQAAQIAALRSHFSGSAKAEVMCALVKHVIPVKGGHPGQVKVREVEETLRVALDPDLEQSLQVQ